MAKMPKPKMIKPLKLKGSMYKPGAISKLIRGKSKSKYLKGL